jgi:sugar phosphate isomerase/epimerase
LAPLGAIASDQDVIMVETMSEVPQNVPQNIPRLDLIGSYWTIAGAAFPHTDREFSPFDFRDRVEALAGAGFTGMGIWHSDLEHILLSYTLPEMKTILDDNGIRFLELEFIQDWFVEGEEKVASDVRKEFLLEASAALNAHHVKVGDFFHKVTPMPKLIESFAALCEDAAEFDATIGFELMPGAMIQTLEETLEMVEGAGAPNGGIILDLWHVVKLGIPYEAAAAIPPQYLVSVEINDGYLVRPEGMDFVTEVTEHRNFCGREEFDIKPFVAAVWNAGYRGPWGVEVLRKAIRPWPLGDVVKTAYETTLEMFDGLEA